MADAKISALTELAAADVAIATDFLTIVDTTAGATKKISPNHVLGVGTARQVVRTNAGATALEWGTPITLASEQASTSGTELDFTSIPAGVKRITVMFKGVSTNGTSSLLIQLGDSGGFENSGYLGASTSLSHASAVSTVNYTAGFGINVATAGATLHGAITLSLEDASDFTWVAAGTISHSELAASITISGSKSLSAELTQVRITTVNGSDTFDAGVVNISYE